MKLPECQDILTAEFARELIAAFGGDPSPVEDGDWIKVIAKYPEYLGQTMAYFEAASSGNPAWAAFSLVAYCNAPLDWGMRIIENAKVGDPSGAAYFLAIGGASPDWAMRVTEAAKTGDPSWIAYQLVEYYNAPLSWGMKVIETAVTGGPGEAAYRLVAYCGAPLDWAMGVIGNAKTGNPSQAAHCLVRDCGAPADWYDRTISSTGT